MTADGRSDAELMAAHVAGDAEAFGELFRRHRDRMWAVALRTVGDRDLAADCVQDAFVTAFRRAETFRGDASVSTWLHRVVVNTCLDRLRRRRPTDELPAADPAAPGDSFATAQVRLDVEAALAQLPDTQRAALVLVDMYAVPVAEAATILQVAEGTVKSRCSRGRDALAQLLGLPGRVPGRDPLSDRGDHAPVGNHPDRRNVSSTNPQTSSSNERRS